MRSQGAGEGGGAGGRPCLRGASGSCPAASAGNAALCGSLSPLSENSATGTEMAAASPPSSVASSPGSCAGDQEDSARDGPHGRCGRRGPRGRVSHQSPGSEDLAHLIKRRLLSPVTSPLDRGGPGPGGCMAREPPQGTSRAHEVGEPFPGLQGARARSRGGRGRKQAVTAPASAATAGQCGADSGRNLSCRGHRLPACVCGRLAAARVRWSRVRGSGTLRWSNHRSRLDARLDSAELSFYYRYCFGFGWFCHQPLSPWRKRGCWAPVDQHGGQALLLRTFH